MSEYPRVTEILKAYTHFENVPAGIMKKACARGSTVHALCAGIAKGAWVPDAMIQNDYVGYVNSFRKWVRGQVAKFEIIETRYADDKLKYTGQVDFVVKCRDEKLYLIDIKTSANPQKTYPIQMAAYKYLLGINGIDVNGAMLVYLDKDAEFPNIHFLEDLEEEFHIFLSALDCYHYFNKRKKDGASAKEHPPKDLGSDVGVGLHSEG
jgi:hypothetical protein